MNYHGQAGKFAIKSNLELYADELTGGVVNESGDHVCGRGFCCG